MTTAPGGQASALRDTRHGVSLLVLAFYTALYGGALAVEWALGPLTRCSSKWHLSKKTLFVLFLFPSWPYSHFELFYDRAHLAIWGGRSYAPADAALAVTPSPGWLPQKRATLWLDC